MRGEKTANSAAEATETRSAALGQLQDTSKAFEKDVIGSFVLKLYHDLHIQTDGNVLKQTVRREFYEYTKAMNCENHFGIINIGTLLRSNNFLYHTPKGSEMFCIPMKKLFEFRNEKLKLLDESRIQNTSALDIALQGNNDSDNSLEATVEVSPDAEEFPVIYKGGCHQQVVPDFTLTSLGCFICQKNFRTQSLFEDHLSIHGFESDFEFLSTINQNFNKKNVFEVNYRLCNASHYFNFTMKSKEKDLVIEKIIIVQTRLLHYVKNHKVPYEISTDGMDSFLVDSHLFTIGVEQPIVVVYRYKFDKASRFVEQHHFLRTEEFPQVHFPIRSYRVPYYKVMKPKWKLQEYYPSAQLKAAQKEHFSDSSLCNISEKFRKYLLEDRVLNAGNMRDVLKSLVEIEDLEGMRDYITLRQKAIKINRFGREYSVKLRGLPKHIYLENIVTPLDEIILILSDGSSDVDDILQSRGSLRNDNGKKRKKMYYATVERVYDCNICFKYEKGTINENKLYDIILRPSRLGLKYQYRAIEMLSSNPKQKQYLFPTEQFISNCRRSAGDLELFNPTIKNNPEQLQAVENIADGENTFAPYVIFGPPGTGKTSTVVEAVLQLWKRHPNTRILITAGSNSACDEVAIRLCRVFIDLQPDQPNILRIFAKSNEKRLDNIDDILIQASNFYRVHFYPAVEVIREYRIIVCTLSVVGKLVTAAIGDTFFTHVFIDECAASTEPEVLVGWMGTSSPKTRLIVSGDHKQLGPILRSKRTSELGLNVSFMERLMSQKCYAVNANGDYNRSIQTRLVQNFRSSPEIVNLYNNLYYDGKLKAMATKDDTTWALQWHMLPNKNYPIIFHSVYGSSARTRQCVSLCNQLEVDAVMDYVKDLMYFGIKGRKIEETDIGIISPYKKQYTKIQEELNQRQWHQIEVGAVETFQGKEKAIIIVSTVRSFTKSLGFLDNPRRLNVILSRPKCLLIIIGNPKTLSQNKDFKYIIDVCRENKCTVGGFRGYNEEKSVDKQNKNNSKNVLENNSKMVPENNSKKDWRIRTKSTGLDWRNIHAKQNKLPDFVKEPPITGDDFVEAIVKETLKSYQRKVPENNLKKEPIERRILTQSIGVDWKNVQAKQNKLPNLAETVVVEALVKGIAETNINKPDKKEKVIGNVDVNQLSRPRFEETMAYEYVNPYPPSYSQLDWNEYNHVPAYSRTDSKPKKKSKSNKWCQVS